MSYEVPGLVRTVGFPSLRPPSILRSGHAAVHCQSGETQGVAALPFDAAVGFIRSDKLRILPPPEITHCPVARCVDRLGWLRGVPLGHSRRAPRRCDPDMGAWCSSTKVLASIPIRAPMVTIGTPVAQVTVGVSGGRHPAVRVCTIGPMDAMRATAMIRCVGRQIRVTAIAEPVGGSNR